MKFRKVLETVYIKDWNTTAMILENDIVVSLFRVGVFQNEKECFEHINENCKGWVQSSETYAQNMKQYGKIQRRDYLTEYRDLYAELREYATKRYGKEFKLNA